MARQEHGRIHWDPLLRIPSGKKKRKKLRKADVTSYDELLRLLNVAPSDEDDTDGYAELARDDIGDLKALTKKKAIKAITSGKVLNTKRRKFRKWRKHDKRVLKQVLTGPLVELVNDGTIGRKRAKKIRKIATKRILSCFYGEED